MVRIEAKQDRILAILEGSGARDDAEEALPLTILEAIGDRVFTSTELMAHTAVDERLQAAIEACCVQDASELGLVLRGLKGFELRGVRLERVGRCGDGVLWRVQVM
jgi:hypothetical protein